MYPLSSMCARKGRIRLKVWQQIQISDFGPLVFDVERREDGSSQKATQRRLISEISLFSLVFKRRATGEKAVSSAHRESAKSALFL